MGKSTQHNMFFTVVFTPVSEKIWKFDRSIDFAENFDRMKCKTMTFGEDSHKKL